MLITRLHQNQGAVQQILTMTIIIIDKLTHARTQLAIQQNITTFTHQSSAFKYYKHSISMYNQLRRIHKKSRLRKVLAEQVCLQHGFERWQISYMSDIVGKFVPQISKTSTVISRLQGAPEYKAQQNIRRTPHFKKTTTGFSLI